jgi:hypothetical protein
LVARSPNDQVSLVNVGSLLFDRGALNELHTFFLAFDDLIVELFGVASQTSERIQIAILIREHVLFEVGVAVLLGILHLGIEDLDCVSVQYFYVSILKLWQLLVIEVSGFIPEKSEAFTNASAARLMLTKTALFTVMISLENSLREFTVLWRSIIGVVVDICRAIQQEPRG